MCSRPESHCAQTEVLKAGSPGSIGTTWELVLHPDPRVPKSVGWTSHPDNPDARPSLGTIVPEGPSRFSLGTTVPEGPSRFSLGTIVPEGPSRFSLGTIVPEGPSRFRANDVHSDRPVIRSPGERTREPPLPPPPTRRHPGLTRDAVEAQLLITPTAVGHVPGLGDVHGQVLSSVHRLGAPPPRDPPAAGSVGHVRRVDGLHFLDVLGHGVVAQLETQQGKAVFCGGEGRRAGMEGDNRENSGINSLGGVLDKSSTSARARESGPRASAEPPGLPTRQSREAGGTRRKGDLHAQQSPLQSPEMPPGPIHASCSPGADHTPKTWSGGSGFWGSCATPPGSAGWSVLNRP